MTLKPIMQTDNKIQLLQNFLNGSITDQELKNLFVWLNSEKGNLEFEKLLNEKWLTNKFQTTENIDSTILFSKIKSKIENKQLSGRKHPAIIDGRNLVDPDAYIREGFIYKGIGRGDKNGHAIVEL